jgi:ribosomal protein S18 acetylase RimI-like enzyme
MDIELRKAQTEDMEFLLALRLATMDEHLRAMGITCSTENHRERAMLRPDCAHIILVRGESAGMVKFRETANAIELMQLQVLPEYQGKGVGQAVLDGLLEQAESCSRKVVLTVLKKNPALRLYQRNGFVIVGEDDCEFHMERALS